MSKLWANAEVASIPLGGMGQVTSGGFRSLYADVQAVSGPAVHDIVPLSDEDMLEQARIEAFAMGFDEGSRVTAEESAANAEARDRLAEALTMLAPAPSGMLSTMLSATVVRLVEQIVGEVEIDIERLVQRCDIVAAFIEDNDDKSALHLHPDDATLLEDQEIGVKLVADRDMHRGCVRLETADGWVEDGPDVRLSRLRALLDDMEGKA
ncbi:FliH/SctL family protein [Sphingobium bisphenolivorans]|uniref:FliH/SctL family protein n=1 Tax=Sphingobium bisphenolivorans TaxID=1335760 RepID=UPI0003A49452|nr:flagellar biosynthesis protein [Sphingobium bisphenolivorans]